MRHWIRDTVVNEPPSAATYDGAFFATAWVLYHFLRTAGWKWIWEDDHFYYGGTGSLSNSSHCTDSNMEDAGTAAWTPDPGITLAKDKTQRHMLTQSLKITNGRNGSAGDVDSSTFTGMSSSLTFHCVLRYRNPTSNTYTATVRGVTVNLTPTAGAWEEVNIEFVSSGGADVLQIGCPDVSGVNEDIWIDSINIFYSWYEDSLGFISDPPGAPDGQILNGNEFHADSYNFLSGSIGWLLCVWDPTNEGNSGVWTISGVNGTDAVLNLRAGGSPALTAATGLKWRLLNPDNGVPYYNGNSSILAGFGLESPHSTKWRFFVKPNWVGGPANCLLIWMSPTDADFDVETGHFDKSFPTIYDVWDWQYETEAFGGHRIAGDSGYRAGTQQRMYVVTDDNGSYLQWLNRDVNDLTAYGIMGVMGADAVISEEESFVSLFVVGSRDGYDDLKFDFGNDDSFHAYGAQATLRGFMVDAGVQIAGYATNSNEKSWTANGKANPFSGNEWTVVPTVIRDRLNDHGEFAQSDLGAFGVRHCRVNYPEYSLVDPDLFHIREGWCMPWPTGVTPL